MELSFKIGSRTETLDIEDSMVLDVLMPDDLPEGLDEDRKSVV